MSADYEQNLENIKRVSTGFAAVIAEAGAEYAFDPKNTNGITVVIPQQAVLEEIMKKVQKMGEIESAAKEIKAYVFDGFYPTPDSWISNGTVTNRMTPPVSLNTRKETQRDVRISAGTGPNAVGAVICLKIVYKNDKNPAENLAIWEVREGTVPTVGTVVSASEMMQIRRKKKQGGYAASEKQNKSERYAIGLAIENEYANSRMKHESRMGGSDETEIYGSNDFHGKMRDQHRRFPARPAGEHFASIYRKAYCSLILFLKNKGEMELLHDMVIPMATFCNLDIYCVLEPHNFTGDYLIPSELISEWWAHTNIENVDIEEASNFISSVLEDTSGGPSKFYTDRPSIIEKTCELREHISNSIVTASGKDTVQLIEAPYNELEDHNTIGGTIGSAIGPIYPAKLAAYLGRQKGLKFMYDSLQYVFQMGFHQLTTDGRFDPQAYNELMNMTGECLYAATPEARAAARPIANKIALFSRVEPSVDKKMAQGMLLSTGWLHWAMTRKQASDYPQKNATRQSREDEPSTVWNIMGANYIHDAHIISVGKVNEQRKIIAALSSLKPSDMTPEITELINSKAKAPQAHTTAASTAIAAQ
jgi:hypothetical protein